MPKNRAYGGVKCFAYRCTTSTKFNWSVVTVHTTPRCHFESFILRRLINCLDRVIIWLSYLEVLIMKKRLLRRRIYTIMTINIFLAIILTFYSCYYNRNENDIKNNDKINGNEVISGNEAEQLLPTLSINSNGIHKEEPPYEKEEQPPEEILAEELALYSGLPYFKEEYIDKYIDYKKQNPDLSYEKAITYVNIGLNYDFYESISNIGNGHDITVLVNKYNKLPDDFVPELVQIDSSMCAQGRGEQHLQKPALEAFSKMYDDGKQLGLDIRAYGTYRSIPTQHWIWNNAVDSGRTIEDVDGLNARGGHSEHHTGLAVDVVINDYDVEQTEEWLWYRENAHKYGFIIRYPKGKEHITGYKYEPWHLRYLGIEIASDIYERDITYEEYFVQVLQPPIQ